MSSSEDAPSLEPDGPYVSFVRQRRSAILERLGDACARAGRDVASVTLAAVSKTVGPVEAVAAMLAGYEVFAENRPQELVRKLDALATAGIEAPRFDMIGNLQKNKINQVLGRASLIQSISSATLAQAVSKRAEREGLRVEIQSHPYDFCELNDEACDMVKSFRSKNLGDVYSSPHGFFYDQGKGDVRHMLKYAGDELTHVLFADTFNQTLDCRYILNPPSLNQRGREDVSVHQHLNLGMGDVDFDGIFETLREMDFANKQLKPDAPKVGGDNIACVSIFGFPEKMNEWAPAARERIENELLKK